MFPESVHVDPESSSPSVALLTGTRLTLSVSSSSSFTSCLLDSTSNSFQLPGLTAGAGAWLWASGSCCVVAHALAACTSGPASGSGRWTSRYLYLLHLFRDCCGPSHEHFTFVYFCISGRHLGELSCWSATRLCSDSGLGCALPQLKLQPPTAPDYSISLLLIHFTKRILGNMPNHT